MNRDILSIDAIVIEEAAEKSNDANDHERDSLQPGTSLPLSRRFGSVDLWKMKGTRRQLRNYRSSTRFSI